MGDALDKYEAHLRDDRRGKKTSYAETIRRLKCFFPEHEMLLATLDPETAASYYAAFRERKTAKGTPISVDYHRNTLIEARSFLRWCKDEKRWTESNPLEGVKGVGKRSKGKPQLRFDEARAWLKAAFALADEGKEGPVAALMAMLIGLRASEIVNRKARDVDDEGRLIWIGFPETRTPHLEVKTAKSQRVEEVPEELRPYLLRIKHGKKPTDLLFEGRGGKKHFRDWVNEWVQRICTKTGIPAVCAHSMRGLQATVSIVRGLAIRETAEKLGHESTATTLANYAEPTAVARARQQAMLKVVRGGKK
jgi:integrase